jgi:hypothetical protein
MALTLDDLRSSESIQLISPPPTKREDNRYPWSLSVTNDTTTAYSDDMDRVNQLRQRCRRQPNHRHRCVVARKVTSTL